MTRLPAHTRTYRNHHLDSTRWDAFLPRPDDIVVATSYKAGTTWTQAIIANLLFPGQSFPAPPWQLSPWLDYRVPPLEEVIGKLEGQNHRRFVKTHLPLDGLRYFEELRYVFVSRDGRDVAMSLWNHYRNYTDEAFARYNGTPGRVGGELPRPPASLEVFWRDWCTRGWFDWEGDGWPFWSHLGVTQSWWNFRHMPNILMMHFSDMKRDPAGSVRRIADFLEIPLTPARLAEVVDAAGFEAMKRRGEDYVPNAGASWKGGIDTFMNKGTNGRWQELLSGDDLALYDAACDRALSRECRAWLDNGGAA